MHKKLEKYGVFVSIFLGHCNPEKYYIDEVVKAGVDGFIHLGNACQEGCSRKIGKLEKTDVESNLVKWVLENPTLCPPGVELIVDGSHLSREFVKLIYETVKDKIILVTDALGPSGLKDGLYKLGSGHVRKLGNNFYIATEDGNFILKNDYLPNGEKGLVKWLAGSASALSTCVKKFVECISSHHETTASLMQAICTAVVKNPRAASLSKDAIRKLPDDKNFAIFNANGDLILSMCQSVLREHVPIRRKINEYRYLLKHGLLSEQKKNKTSHMPSEFSNQTRIPSGISDF